MAELREAMKKFVNAYTSYEKYAGGKNTPKHVSIFDLSLFLAFKDYKSKDNVDLRNLILDKFKIEDIWYFVSVFSTCTCCEKCSCKFNREPPTQEECKCQCWSLYNLFVRSLEKDAKERRNYAD